MRPKIPVAVWGAPDPMSQYLLAALADHPWVQLDVLLTDPDHAGRRYGESSVWSIPLPPPDGLATQVLRAYDADFSSPVVLVASCDHVPEEFVAHWLREGRRVITNQVAWGLRPEVPLIVPEINADHYALTEQQLEWSGRIIACPQPAATALALVIGPFIREMPLERLDGMHVCSFVDRGCPSPDEMSQTFGLTARLLPDPTPLRQVAKVLGWFAQTHIGDYMLNGCWHRSGPQLFWTVQVLARIQTTSALAVDRLQAEWKAAHIPEFVQQLPTTPASPWIRVHTQRTTGLWQCHAWWPPDMGVDVFLGDAASDWVWLMIDVDARARGGAFSVIHVTELSLWLDPV